MAAQNRTTLKSYFDTGDIPTQAQFTDLIDSTHIATDDGAVQIQLTEGAFVNGDKTKLDGIATGATADQSGAQIKAAYEAEADTNAFNDAAVTKLAGIATGATAWSTAVNADILPDTDSLRDVGSATAAFAEGHFDSLYVGGALLSGVTLADPGADRGLFWDDSAGEIAYLTYGSGLTLTGTTLTASAAAPEGTAVLSTGETGGTKFLREDGDGTCSWQAVAGGGDALVANPLSQFAATTSAQLAGVISDETGTGALVFGTSPTLGGTPVFPATVTMGANAFARSGAHSLTLTTTATTNVTLPASGTLATLGANTFTDTQDFGGQQVEGMVNKVVTSVTGTLTTSAHSGNILKTSGNVTIPTTAGFNAVIIAGGAHTVTFNGTTSAAMAAGDVMTVMVESATVIHAVLTAAADKVGFT